MPRGKTPRPKTSPNRRTISGRGDYATVAAVSGLAKKLDSVLKKTPKGSFAARGSNIGAAVGRALGSGLSAITGYGDYTVRGNSLGTVSTSTDMVPEFVARREGDHSTRIRHREYLFDLKVPTDPTSFSNGFVENINPGNPNLFPWLSKMSKLYTQYRIHGMVFVYKTMSSNYSASGGPLGTVVIATNYNVNDKKFETKIQMENSEFAVSTDPSRNIVHAIECDPKSSGLQTLYIRDPSANDPTTVGDARFFDYAKLQLATTGLPGTPGTVMGEVWCSYDIELIKPVVGLEASPLPPVPVPTVQGLALVSQANGSVAVNSSAKVCFGSMGDEVYRIAGPSSTGTSLVPDFTGATYSSDPIFLGAPGNAIPVVNIVGSSTDTRLRFYRNGDYKVVIYCKFRSSASGVSGALVSTGEIATNTLYTPTLVNVGTGVASQLVGSLPQFRTSHFGNTGEASDGNLPNTLTPLYPVLLESITFSVRVSGLPTYDDTKYASVNMPFLSAMHPNNLIRGFARTLNIEWSSVSAKDIVD